jgi:hypothetical protein
MCSEPDRGENMTTHETQDSFPVLTDGEYDRIEDLWRATVGVPLVQRYASIYWEMFPQVAKRIGTTIDKLTAYFDQITHAVIGQAIQENLLHVSSTGLLVEAIYYKAGGSYHLQEYGRFCFCPDCVKYSRRPGRQHASVCDDLWKAYCHAVHDMLHFPRCLLGTGTPFAFLDVATLGRGWREPGETVALQQAIAAYLRLDVRAVQEMWVQFGQSSSSGEDSVTSQVALQGVQNVEAFLLRHARLFGTYALIPVVEDDAVLAVVAEFALALQQRSASIPFWIGVGWESQQRWYVLDPTYGQGRILPGEQLSSSASEKGEETGG